MKLVNVNTKQPIVEFQGEKTLIYSKFLEHEMQSIGISIPPGLRGLYHGKDCVRLEDEDFQRAFKEVFYVTAMNPKIFLWLN